MIKIWLPLILLSSEAFAGPPLSAIEWLQTTEPPIVANPVKPAHKIVDIDKPDQMVVQRPLISVSPLSRLSPEAVGLLPSYVTGFPGDLWVNSPPDLLARLIRNLEVGDNPAMQALLLTLLLAETDPPKHVEPGISILLARVDKLIEIGAIEPALALVERAGSQDPALFSRAFDLALLADKTDPACRDVLTKPTLEPDYTIRIFCHVRNGDWALASFMLENAIALGEIEPRTGLLLDLFLNPDLAESTLPPVPSIEPSPLEFRLFEAIGSPLQTASLPVSFAIADLSGNSGWKAQLEAAERLVKSGALSENQLLGIYTARLPAASGGVWDRVAGLQRFDQALIAGTPREVEAALAEIWPQMNRAGLAVGFARMFGRILMEQPSSQTTDRLRFDIQMLAPIYQTAAQFRPLRDDEDRFLTALAQGTLAQHRPFNDTSTAVLRGFTAQPIPSRLRTLLDQRRLGEVILRSIAAFSDGAAGDSQQLSESLATLQEVGLNTTAQSAALQLLILKRRQ